MVVGGQRHAPAALPPGNTRYPSCRRLGVPHGRSGRVRKISPPTPGFDPRIVQPVGSHHTDWYVITKSLDMSIISYPGTEIFSSGRTGICCTLFCFNLKMRAVEVSEILWPFIPRRWTISKICLWILLCTMTQNSLQCADCCERGNELYGSIKLKIFFRPAETLLTPEKKIPI